MVTAFTEKILNTKIVIHCIRSCKDIKAKVSLYLQQDAMGNKQPVGLGDKNTADVRLYLIDSATVIQYPRNTLLLHSHVLKKSEFFETKLSQSSYSPKRPFEIKITCNPESYIKCIQLIYSYYTHKCFNFTDVDEALAILPVASEVMSRDCKELYMRYLASVRWSLEQEAKLRVLLSSLNINVLPDLAARLGIYTKADCEHHIKMLKESLEELLQMTYDATMTCYGSSEFRNTVEQHIFDYFKLKNSPAVKDACRHVIFNRFKADVKVIKSGQCGADRACDDLSWLLGAIRHCDSKLFATAVKEFCEDSDLRDAVDGECVKYLQTARVMSTILFDQILKAMESRFFW